MKKELIVFDWDGTLANSVNLIANCKRILAKKYSLSHPSKQTIKNVLGMGFNKALQICFPTAKNDTLNSLAEEYHQLMQQDAFQAALFPNVKRILYGFKKQKILLAIATSKSRLELNRSLTYHNLTEVFDITCCSEEYLAKPHPKMLVHILERFNLQPNKCIMIGDTTYDLEFSRNADVDAIAVTFGAHSPERLMIEKPLALLDKWIELPNLLEKICASN